MNKDKELVNKMTLKMGKRLLRTGDMGQEDYDQLVTTLSSNQRGRVKSQNEEVAEMVMHLSGAVLHMTDRLVKLEKRVKKMKKGKGDLDPSS